MRTMILNIGPGSNLNVAKFVLDSIGKSIGWPDGRSCFHVNIGSMAVSPIVIKSGRWWGNGESFNDLIVSSVLGETTGIRKGA